MKMPHKRNYKMLAKWMICISFIILALPCGLAYAQEEAGQGSLGSGLAAGSADSSPTRVDMLERQAKAGGIDKIKDEIEKRADDESMELLEGYDPEEIISGITEGSFHFSFSSFLDKLLYFLFKEFQQNLGLLLKLTAVIIICALFKNIQSSFLNESISEVAFYAGYIIIISILLVSFSTAVKIGTDIIDGMIGFMYATLPVLITLVVSGGNITTGGVFQPVMLMAAEVAATVIRSVFIPLIFLSTVLTIVNNISDRIQLTKLAALMKQITNWALVTIMTVFTLIVSLQGSLGAVVDGVTSKAAKFAIGAFIPVIGKTLSDAADTVIGCTLLIKNAAGVAVLLGIVVICAVPLLKIISLVALYKAASALLEPISEKRVTNCINDVAGSMLQIFAVTAAVAFMFMILVTALISAGNLSAMLR